MNKIGISYPILLSALLSNQKGSDACSLAELNPTDFEDILKQLRPQLETAIARYARPIIIDDRFILQGVIILSTRAVEEGTIRTFNKTNFKTEINTFAEISIKLPVSHSK